MTSSHLSLRLTRTLGVAGSVGPFSSVMGEAVAVAVATCPAAFAPSVDGLTLSALAKENAGREDVSPEGLGAAKEKFEAEGNIEVVEGVAPKEKREEPVERKLKARPDEEEEIVGAAVEAGGAEVEAGVIEGIWNDGKTGGGGLDMAGA